MRNKKAQTELRIFLFPAFLPHVPLLSATFTLSFIHPRLEFRIPYLPIRIRMIYSIEKMGELG
jgi:hypothetical protein